MSVRDKSLTTSRCPTDGFTSGQVVSLTGLSYRTLDHWARTRFIVPSISIGKGTGSDRLYSSTDVQALRVARQLRQKGISTQALRRVVDKLRQQGIEQPLTQARIFVAGKDLVTVAKSTQEIISVLQRPGQHSFTFVIDIPDEVEPCDAMLQHRKRGRKPAASVKKQGSKGSKKSA